MDHTDVKPRPAQRDVLAYASLGGKMGVSAVPGSGKTWTLSLLAAEILAATDLDDDQEILIVTLVNAAVGNFATRLEAFVESSGRLPGIGYRIRTLHGLAHDIVRERPTLAGLSEEFTIVDEPTSHEILEEVALSYLRSHPAIAEELVRTDIDDGKRKGIIHRDFPGEAVGAVRSLVKQAKDDGITSSELEQWLDDFPESLALLEMASSVYSDYQRALAYRGAVDFDDLVRLADRVIQLDPTYRDRLRYRWPFILEDEAQDSSASQERILDQIAGAEGNWVRVGDPNQAIYETFTTAHPKYLREFINREGVRGVDLPNSGRSQRSIMDLANHLIDWVRNEHPVAGVRSALDEPYIEPTPPGDPQRNPPDNPSNVKFIDRPYTEEAEVAAIVKSAQIWIRDHPDMTCAILVPTNAGGAAFAEALKKQGVPHRELLRSSRPTRETAGALTHMLLALASPLDSRKMAQMYRVWRRDDREGDELEVARYEAVTKALRDLQPEAFAWVFAAEDPIAAIASPDPTLSTEDIVAELSRFRKVLRRWHEAVILPYDQLIMIIAQDLFTEQADLALAHKLAQLLKQSVRLHPEWGMSEVVTELTMIARNHRGLTGFDDAGEANPDSHKGEVIVATIHKAKGLEWDRVYLSAVNNYNFPATQDDYFRSERWWLREKMNLQAELLGQFAALKENPDLFLYDEGTPTLEARWEYVAERVRLLYVGITRARRDLILTWNKGRFGRNHKAMAFEALHSWWEGERQ